MLRLNNKTEQDFLNKMWVERLQKAGIEIKDNRYWLVDIDGTTYITEDAEFVKEYEENLDNKIVNVIPTYTLTDLHYKLSEWHTEYKGLKFGGPIMWKDAPFYFAQYEGAPDDSPFVVYSEYPICAAAMLLANCAKYGAGYVKDISGKQNGK